MGGGGGGGGGGSSVPTFEDRRAQFYSYLLKYYLTRGPNDNATKDIGKLFSRNEIKKK